MSARLRQLMAMPPEWLEISAGVGALLFGLGWGWAHLVMGQALPGSPYGALDALPLPMQLLLIVVCVIGGLTTIGAAWVNEARLRYCACSAVSAVFGLVALYVVSHVGVGPTMSVFGLLMAMPLIAMRLLWLSGHVRA